MMDGARDMNVLDLNELQYQQIFDGADTEIAQRFAFYPFGAQGMPIPGPDFIALAEAINTEERAAKVEGVREKKRCVEAGLTLRKLYLQALYSSGNFWLPLAFHGDNVPVRVIPGHYWGYDLGGPSAPPGDGPRVMIVGKHPAREEVEAGRNFVGPTGEFLRMALLDDIGAADEEINRWYVTNLVRWHNISPKGGALPARWIKDCRNLLHQELRIIRPDYILCIGAEATKELCGDGNTLRNMIGRWVKYRYPVNWPDEEKEFHEAKVMAITQPKYVMMNTDAQPQFETTLRNFVQLTRGQEFTDGTEDCSIQYIYNERELAAYVDWALLRKGVKRVAVDAEWHGKHPCESNSYLRTVQLCCDGKKAAVVVLKHKGGDQAFMPGDHAAVRQIMRLLDRDDVQIVGHYFASDMPWLKYYGMDLRHRFCVPEDINQITDCDGLFPGGVDTGLAAHAHDETADFKLEVLSSRYLGAKRWDIELNEWKKQYCHDNGLKDEELEGYGECPFHILGPYSGFDVIHDWNLADRYLRRGGMLDRDRYGNSSWVPFHVNMLAFPGFLEMGITGVAIDPQRIDDLTDLYIQVRNDRLEKLREEINWPAFNPRSPQHCRDFLFGEHLNGKKRVDPDVPVRLRPPDSPTLGLTPIKTTGNKSQPWERIVARGEMHMHSPSTDKETLGILGAVDHRAMMLRDVRFLDQVMKSVLRPPKYKPDEENKKMPLLDADGAPVLDLDEEDQRVYPGGIATFICSDTRVRSTFLQTKETGRASSARPPLQNLSKRRETDYRRIQGDAYRWKIRSFIVSDHDQHNPTVLLETDYGGAELLGMAVMSRSRSMIAHCLDPNYDIHSHVAVDAFGLHVAPTKDSFKDPTIEGLRVAAKNIIFGVGYGRGAEACARQCKEEGNDITTQQAQTIINTIFNMYPEIPDFQEACQMRVLEPHWMRNCFGRYRRFIPPSDSAALAGLQREAMNFPMQSMVADAVSWALHWLYNHPRKAELGYKIVLQIHDAIVLEVPVRSLDAVYNEIIPECMVEKVPFYATDLDGNRYKDQTAYRFSIDRDVQMRWGEDLTLAQAETYGIDPCYAVAG